MKTWAEMTERERDVLVCQTLGYIPVQSCWWMEPDKRFNCAPNEADGWDAEVTEEERGVEYNGTDERFVGKRFISPRITSRFSTDRAAAMGLLDGFDAFQLWKELSGVHGCELTNAGTKSFIAEGDTMPESICKAFLRSKDVKFG